MSAFARRPMVIGSIAAVLALVIVGWLVLAGAGSTNAGPSSDASTIEECLDEQGVELPDLPRAPGGEIPSGAGAQPSAVAPSGPPAPTDDEIREALEACGGIDLSNASEDLP